MDMTTIEKEVVSGVDVLAPILEVFFPGYAATIGGIKTAVDGLVAALGISEADAVKALVVLKTAQLNPATILDPTTGKPVAS